MVEHAAPLEDDSAEQEPDEEEDGAPRHGVRGHRRTAGQDAAPQGPRARGPADSERAAALQEARSVQVRLGFRCAWKASLARRQFVCRS
jgi:hypothetical protein